MYKPKLPQNAGPVKWIGPENLLYNISGLTHCVRLPPKASLRRPAPAVVMLHGWSGDECAMWLFKQTVPADTAIITPRAPYSLETGGFIWFESEATWRKSMVLMQAFLTALPDAYPLDPHRLILMGFSQGAAMVNSLVLNGTTSVAGAVSLAGFVPDFDFTSADISGLPAFIAHGNRDKVIPVEKGRRTRDVYTQAGANVTYGEYSAGHKIHTQGIKDLKQWLGQTL